jgi:hypothetical protein
MWWAGGIVFVVMIGLPILGPIYLIWLWLVWSPTGERPATDVERCQDEIAAAFVPPPRQHVLFGGEPDDSLDLLRTPVRW